jgi:hypothetical protein
VDAPALVAAVNREVTGRWALEGRLAGGANEGAYLVRGPRGAQAVVKALKAGPDQLTAAARLVAHARAGGWPTPAWYAVGAVPTGLAPAGGSWVLQEFVLGERPTAIDSGVADRLVAIIRGQEGLLPPGRPESDAPGGWDQWIAAVLFEDREGLRSRIRCLPGAGRILRDVDAIAEACSGETVSRSDLVHGDLNLTNTLLTGPDLQVIDVDALAPGPRAFDLAKLIMVSAYMGHATDAGLNRLWSAADSYDPRELASCFGSASLKLTEAVIRHRVYDQAPMILSKIGGILDKVRGRLTA